MTEIESVQRSTVVTTINGDAGAGDHYHNGHKHDDVHRKTSTSSAHIAAETTTPSTPTQKTATLPPRAGTVNSDKVLLHAWPRSPAIPHLSPFVLKLETWLRMANIPYELTDQQPQNPKTQKMPWIEYRGEQMYDSQHIIETLAQNAVGRRNLDGNLDIRERAIARAFQKMIDEHTVWSLSIWRFSRDPESRIFSTGIMPNMGWKSFLVKPLMKRAVEKNAHGQGLGRLDDGVFQDVIKKDLKAISDYMGENPYLMGEQPHAVDASLFGVTSQYLWVDTTSPFHAYIKESTSNLVRHAERIKAEFFPDWNDLLAASPASATNGTTSAQKSASTGSTLTKKEKTPKKSSNKKTTVTVGLDSSGAAVAGADHPHKIHDVDNQPIINTASPGYDDTTTTAATTTTTKTTTFSEFPVTNSNAVDAALINSAMQVDSSNTVSVKGPFLVNGSALNEPHAGTIDVGGAGDTPKF